MFFSSDGSQRKETKAHENIAIATEVEAEPRYVIALVANLIWFVICPVKDRGSLPIEQNRRKEETEGNNWGSGP